MKKITTLFLFFVFALNIARAETEPNNVWNQANLITIGATGSGTADLNYDEDWWRIATPSDGKLTLTWSSLNGSNVYCQIYDTLGVQQFASAYTTGSNVVLNVDGIAKGNYYVRFIAYFNTESTTYNFIPTFTAASVPNNIEPDDIFTQANTLAVNDSVTGHIGYFHNGYDDLTDWWKITTTFDGRIDFTIYSLNNQNVYAELFASDGTTQLAGNYTTATATYSKDGLAPGVYYIRIRNYFNYEFAPYALKNNLVLPLNTAETGSANDSQAQAKIININDSVNGHVGYDNYTLRDTLDWYKITTTADGQINISLNVYNNQNVYAQLYDGDGVTLLTGNYTTTNAVYSKDGLAAGTYYIRIINYYSNYEFAPYSIRVTLNTTVPNDAEPNGTRAQALNLNLNDSVTGHIGYYYNGNDDLEDWYKIITPTDGQVNVTIYSLNSQNVYALLYDNDGVTYLTGSYTTTSATYSINGLAAGTYYIQIKTYYNSEWAPYALMATLTSTPNNDVESNGTPATALTLPINASASGHINYFYNAARDTFDFYSITLPVDGKLSWTINSLNAQNVYATLLDHDGVTIIAENYTTATVTQIKNNLGAGTYYIRIRTYYGNEFAPYTLSSVLEPMNFLAENAAKNDVAGQGTLLPANTPTGGHLNFYYNLITDSQDWWQIGYDGNGTMNFQLDVEQNHFDTDLPYINYDLYSDTLLAPIYTGQVHTLTNTIAMSGLAVGKYYLKITSAYANFGAYQLTASYTERCLSSIVVGTSSQTAGCSGNITYNLSGGLAPYTVQLYKGAIVFGTPLTGNSSVSFTGLGIGTYNAKVYSFGGSGTCNNASATTTFSIPAVPTISAGGATTFCLGGSVTLTSSASTSYLWSTGATTQAITVTANGSYSVTISNAAGCSNTSLATSVTVNALPSIPTISTGGATTFCQGGSVILTSSTATSYLWSTGATTQAITANSNGSFIVTVTNANGCSATSLATSVTVNALPSIPTISAGGATTFCQGGSVTLTSSAATSYLWSTGATTQAISATANGSFSVTVSNVSGCTATSLATAVTVNANPTVTFSPLTAKCTTDAAFALSGGSPAGGTYSGTGVSGGQFNPATAGVGSFVITYIYTNGSGCTATATQNISVINCGGCTPTISTNGAISFCQGGSVTLTASSGVNYLWSTGATTQAITVNSTGNYSVTVTNVSNCTGTSGTTVVTVNALPSTPTITAGGATSFCQGGSVTLTSSASTSYLWSTGATTQVISANANGSYSVTVTNANGCSATSLATSINVNALPSTPTITSGGATTFCQGGSVTLTSSLSTSYLWSTGATTQAISANANGSYSVTVTNANGCSATSLATSLTVNANPTVTFSPLTSKCTTDAAFALSGGSPAGGTYSGTVVSGGQFDPATAGVGSFVITYSYTNGSGCSASATQNISVTNCGGCIPTISANGAISFCQGGSVTLTASSGINYLWSTGATTQAITVNSNGSYAVTVTNANNCTGTSGTTGVTVNPLPSTPTISAGGATTFCQGGSVTLTSSAASSYVWSTGATTQAISVATNGNYSVTVKNSSGCSASSASTTVTVTANVAASISGNTSVCLGSATALLASSGSLFMWNTGATTQSINVSPTTNTSYSVTVTSAGGCTSTASTTVTVSNCGGTYCIANGTSKNKGYIYKVKLNSINKTSGWNGGYGNFLTTSTTLTKGRSYSVAITPGYASCSIACLYTRVWIDWNQDGDFNDPGELVFAPSGSSFLPRYGSINVPPSALNGSTRMRVAMEYGSTPTSCGTFTYGEVEDYTINVGTSNCRIDDSQITTSQYKPEINFVMYPNPASDVLSIHSQNEDGSLNTDLVTQVELIDVNGKIILQATIQSSENQIDVSQVQAGIYFVRMIAKGDNLNVNAKLQRVIITH